VLLAAVMVAAGARAQEAEPRFLDVTAGGYSRFEISDGDVVAFVTGGVEATYLGYHLTADELRYNQATQAAVVTGSVRVAVGSMLWICDEVRLDGAAGEAVIDKPLSGTLSEPALGFQAGAAKATFPPGKTVQDISDVNLRLSAGVVVTGPGQTRLEAPAVAFDGASLRISTEGQFVCTGDMGPQTVVVSTAKLDFSEIRLEGTRIVAQLTKEGALDYGQVDQPVFSTPEMRLSADRLTVRNVPGVAAVGLWWEVEFAGSPITGRLESEGRVLAFNARTAQVELGEEVLQHVALQGNVQMDYEGTHLAAESLVVEREGEGYAVKAPEGLSAGFDLAGLSGAAPVDLGGLLEPRAGR